MVTAGKALIDPASIFAAIPIEIGMRAADLGCGRTGHFIFSLSRLVGDTGLVYAVDIIKDVVASIRSRAAAEMFHNLHAVWSDIEQVGATPIPAASLDVCFLVNVLFLVGNKAAPLAEAARLLKPGGKLVVIDWARPLGILGPTPAQAISRDTIESLAAANGLALEQVLSAGHYHFALIFRKS